MRADDLPSGVDYTVADFAVNSGPSRAAKYLQSALGVTQDGAIGPQTIAAANAADPKALIKKINADRLAFMKRIQGGKLWKSFGRGWQRRVDAVRSTSLALVDAKPAAPAPKPTTPAPVHWLTALLQSLFGGKA